MRLQNVSLNAEACTCAIITCVLTVGLKYMSGLCRLEMRKSRGRNGRNFEVKLYVG